VTQEREQAFRQLVMRERYQGVVYQGMETAPENWQQRVSSSLSMPITASFSGTGIFRCSQACSRWRAREREQAFRQLVMRERYQGVVYQGMETAPENWQHAQNRLADKRQSG
jgi:hypothetical protein